MTKVLEAAAQAAKDADLDYNGDGKVNVQDLVDADADFQKTGDGFTFYILSISQNKTIIHHIFF